MKARNSQKKETGGKQKNINQKKGNAKTKKVAEVINVNSDNIDSEDSICEFKYVDHNHQFPEDFDIIQYSRTETACWMKVRNKMIDDNIDPSQGELKCYQVIQDKITNIFKENLIKATDK